MTYWEVESFIRSTAHWLLLCDTSLGFTRIVDVIKYKWLNQGSWIADSMYIPWFWCLGDTGLPHFNWGLNGHNSMFDVENMFVQYISVNLFNGNLSDWQIYLESTVVCIWLEFHGVHVALPGLKVFSGLFQKCLWAVKVSHLYEVQNFILGLRKFVLNFNGYLWNKKYLTHILKDLILHSVENLKAAAFKAQT